MAEMWQLNRVSGGCRQGVGGVSAPTPFLEKFWLTASNVYKNHLEFMKNATPPEGGPTPCRGGGGRPYYPYVPRVIEGFSGFATPFPFFFFLALVKNIFTL